MTWKCAAIDHGVTIFPNGKIGPCCQIEPSYLKPLSHLNISDRFADLKTDTPPPACRKCIDNEYNGIDSYRKLFNDSDNNTEGIQFLDIRNTNFCNLKCRYCGPHFSNQWGIELDLTDTLSETNIDEYLDLLLTDSLHWVYFTGGEPMINKDHWKLLDNLVATGKSQNITLLYNSNLSTLKFKDRHVFDSWKHFRSVDLQVSIDAIGEPLEYIRSGSDWSKIKNNILFLLENKNSNITITLTPVISLLNIWFFGDLCDFAKDHNLPIRPIMLTGPDYLALDVVPDEFKPLLFSLIDQIEKKKIISPKIITHLIFMVENNINQCLINHFLSHVMMLDKIRDEKLFDILPFKSLSKRIFLENHEYQ